MRLSCLPLLAVALCIAPLHAQQYVPLSQRMSAAEFKAAGLDRLTPQQLATLDDWLRTHGGMPPRVVDTSGRPMFYPKASERQKFEAHIAGAFSGWSGHSAYALDNGQQWEQVGSSSDVSCNAGDHPAVKVKPSLFGGWLMYVHGCNGSVHVQRTK